MEREERQGREGKVERERGMGGRRRRRGRGWRRRQADYLTVMNCSLILIFHHTISIW